MQKLRDGAAWGWGFWPAVVIAVLVFLHWLTWQYFGARWVNFNKATGAIFQTIGAGVVLFSINENIGTFRQYGFLTVVKKHWARRFWKTPEPVQGACLFAEMSDQFNISAKLSCVPTTIEERLQDLERKIEECSALILIKESEGKGRLEEARTSLAASIRSVSAELEHLSIRVERTLVDGVHMQVFGVFLAVYGTVVGYFA